MDDECLLVDQDMRELLLIEAESNPFSKVLRRNFENMDSARAEEILVSCLEEKGGGLGTGHLLSQAGYLKTSRFIEPVQDL